MTRLQKAALEVLQTYRFEDGAPAMRELLQALAEETGQCINKILEKPKLKPGDPGFEWPACEICGSRSFRCGCD